MSSGKLTGPGAPGTHLSLSPQPWDNRQEPPCPAVYIGARGLNSVLMLPWLAPLPTELPPQYHGFGWLQKALLDNIYSMYL